MINIGEFSLTNISYSKFENKLICQGVVKTGVVAKGDFIQLNWNGELLKALVEDLELLYGMSDRMKEYGELAILISLQEKVDYINLQNLKGENLGLVELYREV